MSDYYGRKQVMLTGILLIGVLAYPLFILVDHGVLWTVLAAQLVFAVLMGLVQGPLPALMVEMFPTRTRLSAVGLGYNLTLAVFGGTAPMICTWLIQKTDDLASPAIYLMVLSAISFICLLTFKSVDNFEQDR